MIYDRFRPSGQLTFCRMRIVIGFWRNDFESMVYVYIASKHLGHFRQANRWSQLSPSGTAPAARWDHTSVWSDVADGMYVFGGLDNGNGCGLSVNGPRDGGMCQGFAEVRVGSMTCTFMTARRREDGICWRFLCKNSSACAWEV